MNNVVHEITPLLYTSIHNTVDNSPYVQSTMPPPTKPWVWLGTEKSCDSLYSDYPRIQLLSDHTRVFVVCSYRLLPI